MTSTEVIGDVPGLALAPGRTGGLRFLHDPARGDWTIDIVGIHRVPATAAQVRAFALGCRDCLVSPPGEYDVEVYDDGVDQGLLGFEIEADGTLNLQLVLNVGGAVSMEGPGYDRVHLHRLVGVLLAATG